MPEESKLGPDELRTDELTEDDLEFVVGGQSADGAIARAIALGLLDRSVTAGGGKF